jgi:PKD repeat protein
MEGKPSLHTTRRPRAPRGLLLAGGAVVLLACLAALPHANAAAVLDNGAVQIGVGDFGSLGAPAANPSSAISLRMDSDGSDGVQGGACGCEGWGIAADGVAGYVQAGASPVVAGVSPVLFSSDASHAISAVQVGTLRVTHDVRASAASTSLYDVNVTVRNVGAQTVQSVLYRRTVDWTVQPTPGAEMVSLHSLIPRPAGLVFMSDDGAAHPNPLLGASQVRATGPPVGGDVDDSGPADHGTLLDLALGCLAAGDSVTIHLAYGAFPSESAALSALASWGAEAWALAEPASDPGGGTPRTFVLAVRGISGPTCIAPAWASTFTTTAPANLTLDAVSFHDATPIPAVPGIQVTRGWEFGDGATAVGDGALHTYLAEGVYDACFHLGLRLPLSDLRTWTSCHRVHVFDRPPLPGFQSTPSANGQGVDFHDLSTDLDGTVVSWAWNYGDGASASAVTTTSHTYRHGGTYRVCLTVADNNGALATTCRSTVAPGTPDQPPFIAPVASVHAEPGQMVSVRLQAVDFDQDPITLSAIRIPGGARFDAANGTLLWLPATTEVGYHEMSFGADDGSGGVSNRTVIVIVHAIDVDSDGDGIPDAQDNCPGLYNPAQTDADHDGVGDDCATTGSGGSPPATKSSAPPVSTLPAPGCTAPAGSPDRDGDGVADQCDPDMDNDGIPDKGLPGDLLDNCPLVPNPNQRDTNGDGFGDACQPASSSTRSVAARPVPVVAQTGTSAAPGPMSPVVLVALIGAPAGLVLGLGTAILVRPFVSRRR